MNKIFEIDSDFNETITEDSNILFNINNCNKITYTIKDSNCNIFVIINSKNSIEENIEIINSNVNMYYIELNNYDFSFTSNINVYHDSEVKINTILLASYKKNLKFNITNIEDHSNCEIFNNVVGLEKANYTLEIIGNILKNSPYTKCIQKTHSITVGNPEKMHILPILNIDNENVVAAHSLSSGTIDDSIMYYLNSRGISKDNAVKLIIESYLSIPEDITNLYKFANLDELYKRKVDSLCLM